MKIKFIVNYFTITLRLHYCTTARPHVEERSDEPTEGSSPKANPESEATREPHDYFKYL